MIVPRPALTAVVAVGTLVLAAVPALAASAPVTTAPLGTAPLAMAPLATAPLATAPLGTAGHHPEPPPLVVAEGLNNPRGLAFGDDGTLYVAESGKGGAGPCQAGPEGGEVCFGRSASITRIRYGHQKRIVTGLPSLASRTGAEAIGATDVGVSRWGTVSFTVGLGADPGLRTKVRQLAGMAKLYELGRRGPRPVADLGAYERKANPDRLTPPDTNPYGLAVSGRSRHVVDAGGNTLLRVSSHGRISTVAVFPRRTVPAPAGIPDLPAGTPVPMQAVPTSAVRGPDGAWYVGELTGFPFPPGQARIYRVVPGHRPTVYATGLTNVIDLAFGPHGRLYALEIARDGLLSGSETGALVRVGRHGGHKVVASAGLRAPGGVAVRGRHAYVTNCSVCAGTGTVVKIRL
ncbi:ScyD/ScyE family protein [Couchioplanes azureus]|uniref:ScyD/ScyE family protein n=1 Tax=Couchioplanes caeruleus TaxID=56438 RepID=UPI001E45163F|nr:ScyD/ScyE family protein [Couchioplanes caeruleus]